MTPSDEAIAFADEMVPDSDDAPGARQQIHRCVAITYDLVMLRAQRWPSERVQKLVVVGTSVGFIFGMACAVLLWGLFS